MPEASKATAVVIANGEAEERITGLLSQFPDEVEVRAFDDAWGALPVLQREPVEMLVVDCDSPAVRESGLLDTINEKPQGLAIIAFAAQAPDDLGLCVKPPTQFLAAPFRGSRLALAVGRALSGENGASTLPRPPAPAAPRAPEPEPEATVASSSHPSRLVIRSGTRWLVVGPSRIRRIEADGNYAVLVCDDEQIRVRSTLSSIFSLLDPTQFFRVHRSMIIRLDQVTEIFNTAQGDYIVKLVDGVEATVTRSRRADFVAALQGAGAFGSID